LKNLGLSKDPSLNTSGKQVSPSAQDTAADSYNRGESLFEQSKFEEALVAYSEAIAIGLQPYHGYALNCRGITYARKGDYEKAVEDYTSLITLEPFNMHAIHNRSIAYQRRGDLEMALRLQNQTVTKHPKDARALFLRGSTHRDRGDDIAAIKDFDEAIRLLPNRIAGFYTARAMSLHRTGEYMQSIEDYTHALNVGGDCKVARNNRWLAYECQESWTRINIEELMRLLGIRPLVDIVLGYATPVRQVKEDDVLI